MPLPTQIGVTKNPETADSLAAALQLLYHADGNVQLQTMLRSQSGGIVTVEWHDPTDTVPAYAIAFHDEWTLILMSGCNNAEQAALTTHGYLVPRFTLSLSERGGNSYFTDLATPIYTGIMGSPRIQNQPLILAGHSLGGCVMQELAWLLNVNRLITDNCSICTFGSPKWAWPWKQHQRARVPCARWMNSDDPVPLVYPTINDYLPFLLQYTAVQAAGVSRFTQSAGGIVCSPDGDLVAGDYPPLGVVEWQVAMGAWLWNWENGTAASPHSLTSYRQRLQAFIARDLPPRDNPRGTLRDAPTEEHNRRLVNRAQATVQHQVQAAEAAQRDVPIRVPRQRLVTVEHRGRVHVLVWNNQVITVITRRRSANSLARSCNRFLEGLLHGGLVEPDAIVEQLRQFLGAAQDPSSGITPTINTTLPEATA